MGPTLTLFLLLPAILLPGLDAAQVCYGGLGCFSTHGAMHALPQNPNSIATTFTLHLRGHSNKVLRATDPASAWHTALQGSGFTKAKPTKVLVHGYRDSGSIAWIQKMVSELLKQGDYMVFVVDWGHGSKGEYPQATANSLLVAAQVAAFLQALQDGEGVDPATVHIIGHSLGGQIAGNAGRRFAGLGRISALDPAEPYFKNDFDNSNRLDKSDATFIDVIHTDGEDFNYLQGYGLKDPVGHVDFYPNGGVDQPGCTDSALGGILGALGGSSNNNIACSHSRSHEYYIESINSQCKFNAHPCGSWADYEAGKCHGCPSDGCPVMGFHADESTATGTYYVSTAQSSLYCGHEYFVEMDLSPERISAYGRIYLTFLGTTHNSREIEFTRENRRYHANDKERHMVAVHTQVGTVYGVRVRFHKADGLAGSSSARHITVHQIIVEDAVTKSRTTFCTHDHAMSDDRTQTYRSHSGC